MSLNRVLIAPARYVQGPNVIANLKEHTDKLGDKVIIALSAGAKKRLEATINASYGDVKPTYHVFNGECSKTEINRLAEVIKAENFNVVCSLGGGKAHDLAKAAAYYTKRSVVIIPTIASSDAPCSALSVIYTDDGAFEEYLFLPRNPDLVLVDTAVIAKAPVRTLVAGMGDALATYFEARASKQKDCTTCAGGVATITGQALARLCYDTLLSDSVKAKLSAEAGVPSQALEAIVEANTLLSGIGFESGGLGAAHAVHNGLTVLEESHAYLHGEKVAFGVMTHLFMENAPMEEIETVANYCLSVGLPIALGDIGMCNVSDEDLMRVAAAAAAPTDTAVNMPFHVSAETVFAAIKAADAYGRMKHSQH
ncbi:Glycerol dehydrogenase [Carpediemonas membranifera]|uniref:Glycerol dehydrogenase n=1 Tax=Carpediemonas membranifera TaxID=201153 RepID=A0A8J6AZ40_9EUKA|nr:Glycerol dehydrogenase [Carpediemonas membranifera]|eukprot:KAG9389492.1 Glycerol dehydrogenase [Carpediemonas membranifera]